MGYKSADLWRVPDLQQSLKGLEPVGLTLNYCNMCFNTAARHISVIYCHIITYPNNISKTTASGKMAFDTGSSRWMVIFLQRDFS